MKKFEEKKKEILLEIENLKKKYDDFTKEVSPDHWRTTGHHFGELNKMLEDIPRMKKITPKQIKAVKEFEKK